MQQIIGESTPAEGLQAVLRSMQRLCNDIYMSLMVIELEMHNGSGDRRLWSRWQDGSEEELYRSGEKYPLLDPLSKPSSLEGGWPTHTITATYNGGGDFPAPSPASTFKTSFRNPIPGPFPDL